MTWKLDEPDFDVIVIGAGVAGSVAADQLAKQGRSVLMIERGETPGSKNLSGGVLYCNGMEKVFPDFLERAPIERKITRNYVSFLNEGSSFAIDYQDTRFAQPVNAVTVLRAKLDAWLADQCTDAGVIVMPGVRVDRVLTESTLEGTQVVGVQAGDDKVTARVVIAADGANSFIARAVGLRPKPRLNHMAVGIKGVVSLPRETIEDRFNVSGTEGAALAVVGDCTQGVSGGGFCYTNVDSISIGVVLRLDDLVKKNKVASDVFDSFLAHPLMAKYLEGGELQEYGCHLVAEGGLNMIGDITMGGLVVVGDAAGLTLNTGLTVRGMDLAVGSAIAAATAVGTAIERQDVGATALTLYRDLLFSSTTGKDMERFARMPDFLERDRLYKEYGELLAGVMHDIFNHDGTPRKPAAKVALNAFSRSTVKIGQLVSDGIAGVRAL